MKKTVALLLSLLLVSGLAAACGSKNDNAATTAKPTEKKAAEESAQTTKAEESAQTTKAEEKQTEKAKALEINVGYMPNYGSLWAITSAIKKGYMADENITVKLVQFQDGPTIISAMESGSIDVGYIGQGAHKLCILGKASIFALSHISNGDAVIGDKNVKTIADLAGKKVAYSSGTSSEAILLSTLDKAGLTMEDIQPFDMDPSGIVNAMISGSVDACATWSPNTLNILSQLQGSVKLTDNLSFADTQISLASWIVMPAFAEKRADDLKRFIRALYKGMDFGAQEANYKEVAEYVADETKLEFDAVYAERGVAKWLSGKDVVAGVKDGTIKGYYELQRQNFIQKDEAVTEEKALPVDKYVLFDLMSDAK